MSKKKQKAINKKKGIVKKGMKSAVIALFLMLGMATMSMAAEQIQVNGLNAGGDVLFLTDTGTFAVGGGTDLARFYDFVNLRLEYVAPVTENDYSRVGGGVGINVVELIKALKGTWLQDNVNVTVGAVGLINLKDTITWDDLELGLYSTIIGIKF